MSKFSRYAPQIERVFPHRTLAVSPEEVSDGIILTSDYLGSSLWERLLFKQTDGAPDATVITQALGPTPVDEIWAVISAELYGTDTASRTYNLWDYNLAGGVMVTIARQVLILVSDYIPWWPNPIRFILGPNHQLRATASALTAGKSFGSRFHYIPLKLGETLVP